MMEATGSKYEECGYASCSRAAESNGFCIFHISKSTLEEKQQLSPDEGLAAEQTKEYFRARFSTLLDDIKKDKRIEKYDFRDFSFPWISLGKTTYLKPVNFTGAKFSGEADFSDATFSKEAKFRHVTFSEKANFRRARFSEKADFSYGTFSTEADFRSATFRGEADFSYRTFSAEADFRSAIFRGEADFSSSIFTFRKKADFRHAPFTEKADFSAPFSKEAKFRHVTFSEKANFRRARFSEKADFFYGTFSGKTAFYGAIFSKEASFNGATFGGDTSFSTEPNKPSFEHDCYFQRLKVKKDAYVEFENVNLFKASFIGTDLELMSFKDVKWPLVKKRFFGRDKALWDELREGAKSKNSYEQIAENYRQLVLNYDRKRDYAIAEQFHIGEMEVLRKKAGAEARVPWVGWLRRGLNGYAIYRLLSHYGTSYWHAGLMLLVLLCCFSWIFLFTGFQTTSEGNEDPEVIEYDWGGSTSVSQWLPDYRKSFYLALSIISLQRARFYEPLEGASQLWLVIATFVLAAQVALVLLAIRRRYKR